MALNDREIRPPSFSAILGIIIGVSVLILVSSSVVIVSAGERAVIFDNFQGVLEDVRDEGMTFVVPFVQKATKYDVKTQTYTLGNEGSGNSLGGSAINAFTSDGQTVGVDLSILLRPDVVDLWKLHQKVGNSYVNKIVIPGVRSVVRTVVPEYKAIEVYSKKRREIQGRIEDELRKSFGESSIILEKFLIRNIKFSPEFQKAIEAKQVALQEAERMQYILQKEKQEKERKIISAEGEAESIKIRGKALAQNPRLIQYEYVQKLAPGVKAVITDQKTIMNFSNLFGKGE